MTKTFKKLTIAVSTLALCAVVLAQNYNAPIIPPSAGGNTGSNVGSSLKNVVLAFKDIATGVYSSLFIVALIAFFVGIIRMFFTKDATSKAESYKFLGFGVVALFVMVGIWGLVAFLSANLGIGVGGDIPTPGVPTGVRTYNN